MTIDPVFVLLAILSGLLGLAFLLIARLSHRLNRRTQSPNPPSQLTSAVPSLSAIIQSREFAEAVRAHILLVQEGSAPKSTAKNVSVPTEPQSAKPTTLTEEETGLLANLLAAADLRPRGTDTDTTLFLPEVNSQFQKDYTRETCESLARKLVALTANDATPILAAGAFIRIRNLRDGITAVDIKPEALAPLRSRFLT